jgi:vitamin B12 transporter
MVKRDPVVVLAACLSARLRGQITRLMGAILLLAAAWLPGAAAAQAPQPAPRGSLTGRVVDAGSLRPLDGAVVVMRRASGGSEPDAGAGRYRSAVTDTLGEYHFTGLEAAAYRLHVRRVGYLADSVDVDLHASDETRLSLALEAEPVLLPPVQVIGRDLAPYLSTESGGKSRDVGRVSVAHFRQEEVLTSDARELTHAEVVEATTLAESDVFRALQRIPGVSTRDDYTATLWTRGASWDQTRVYFDGQPLYNPTHAGWLFSAVNPDAIGAVTFYPGVRSARWGEGAAAILDLKSRTGGENGRTHGRGELSMASARFALDGSLLQRHLSWMVAARRTYVDLLTGIYGSLTRNEQDVIPYDFSDLVARVEGDAGKGWRYNASTIIEQDRLRGGVAGLLQGNHGRWGNRAGQLSVTVPLGSVAAKVSAGETHFRAAILEQDSLTRPRARPGNEPTLPPLESTIRHRLLALELGPAGDDPLRGWGLGYQHVHDAVQYEGPVSLLSALAVLLPRGSAPGGGIRSGTDLGYHVVWGEARRTIGRRVTVEAGVRVEMGDSVPNGGTTRTAPRMAVRWQPLASTTVTAGWSRAYQYTQDVAPVAGPLGPQLHLSHLWVLAEPDRYTAMRAQIETAGAEHWFNEEWLGALNVYHRTTTGLALPNPTAERVTPDRDPDATAQNDASGIELSIRRLSGPWTGSLGYTYGTSTIRDARVTTLGNRDTVLAAFPSPADVRHAVDATASFRVARPTRVGGGFTFGSGVPYTQLILPDTSAHGGDVWLGQPNAKRTPFYASLDLMADYTKTFGAWQVTAYAQLRNALGHDNSVTYARSRECDSVSGTTVSNTAPVCTRDFFAQGIPRLPLIGVRMSF